MRIWVNTHKETCYKPRHRTTNKHGEARCRLNSHEEKKLHSLRERPKLRNAGGPELLGLNARDAQVKRCLEQQNLGELITVEHKVLIETCESGHNHPIRYRGAKFGSLKIRDETKLFKADMESFPWNLALIWSWPWKEWKFLVDTSPFKQFSDCWIAVRWMEEGAFAWLLQLTTWRWMDSMMNCNCLRKTPKARWNCYHFLFFDLLKFHQFGCTVLPESLLEYVWYAGEKFGKALLW